MSASGRKGTRKSINLENFLCAALEKNKLHATNKPSTGKDCILKSTENGRKSFVANRGR